MNDTSLRALLTRDEKTQGYVPAGHNLDPDKAEALAASLRNKGLHVSVAFQTLRHKGRGYKNCESCKTAAENLSGDENQREENAAEVSEQAESPPED